MWNAPDDELIALGKREIETLGLTDGAPILDGSVVRMPKAYPVYDSHYPAALRTVRGFLDTLPNLQLTGRNGMHRYNNQDHSMLTAMLAVRNLLGARHDLLASQRRPGIPRGRPRSDSRRPARRRRNAAARPQPY
ncbi:MAG: hypothetical protein R2724_27630 [Bryobacterales bacterium]